MTAAVWLDLETFLNIKSNRWLSPMKDIIRDSVTVLTQYRQNLECEKTKERIEAEMMKAVENRRRNSGEGEGIEVVGSSSGCEEQKKETRDGEVHRDKVPVQKKCTSTCECECCTGRRSGEISRDSSVSGNKDELGVSVGGRCHTCHVGRETGASVLARYSRGTLLPYVRDDKTTFYFEASYHKEMK